MASAWRPPVTPETRVDGAYGDLRRGIDHAEYRAGVRARRAQELQAIGLRLRKGALMREDHGLARLVQAQRDEHSAARHPRTEKRELVLVDV